MQTPNFFYEGGYDVEKILFEENIERLVHKYPIFTNDLFDLIVTAISKDKEIDPIKFLLEIKNKNIGDGNNLFIIQYLVAKFEHKELQKYVLYENLPKDLDQWFEYMNFLNNCDLIDMDKLYHHKYPSSIPQLKYTFEKYSFSEV
jgi:hypothetical protein